MTAEEIETILERYSHDPFVEVRGIQYFSGTQKTSLKRLKRELDRLDALFQDWEKRLGFLPGELELGPGLPVAYFPEDDFDEPAFLEEVSSLLEHMAYQGPKILELGRSIAASCGTYVTRVVDVKSNATGNYNPWACAALLCSCWVLGTRIRSSCGTCAVPCVPSTTCWPSRCPSLP